MRIGVYDPSGCGLGTAIGLLELGHDVAFEGPRGWFADGAGEADRLAGELARRHFGPRAEPFAPEACDLVVVVDVFADFLTVFERHGGRGPEHLMAASDAELVQLYPERLRRALELARRAERIAIVDGSDCRGPREIAFEQLPNATLLARECGRTDAGPWRPFPFLWNNVMLWLERLRPMNEWWLPPSARPRRWDWTFCGTVDHPRYGQRRRQQIAETTRRWPHLRGLVQTDIAFRDVLAVLQSGRFGLDLPGAGELCFRLHECLALGVPVLQPEPFTIASVPGIAVVVSDDPDALARLDPDAVRAVYLEACSPRAAGQALLDAVAVTASAVSR